MSHFVIIAILCNNGHTLYFLSLFLITIRLCNKFLPLFVIFTEWTKIKTQDLRNGIQDPEVRLKFHIQDPESDKQDQRLRTMNPDPGPEICDHGLGCPILHIVWNFFSRMTFVIWRYSLQINTDISGNIVR